MGAVVFIDTSALVAVLAKEPDYERFVEAVGGAEQRITSPVVRLETCIVLSSRLDFSPQDAEAQLDRLLEAIGIVEIDITSAIGALAVECFARFGKGRHPARLNFADCLSYACAKAHGARLIYKGDDFAKADINQESA